MKKIVGILFALLMCMAQSFVSAEPVAVDYPRYGSYEVLSMTTSVIKGVKCTENQHIYIQLAPEYKDMELIIRISNHFKSGYRKWYHGAEDFVAPANRGLAEHEFSDWIETKANYIEYWIDGRLVLHLHKVADLK